MSNTARTAAKLNIYQIVTDRIIHSLEAGVIPCVWRQLIFPVNDNHNSR